ncbi:unnamed protein product [Vicia faba]|uniref:PB1-like domain-containing protein n=1 Tax=Vicia faba TaxID=3906 RepID=A0AAV0ZAI2_VICFA|nr:unnamed protein product [Vicia faba]
MSDRFECVFNHEGVFGVFNRLGYKGLEEIWDVDPDFWSYSEILDGLRDLGYPKLDSLWCYDAMDDNELGLLQDAARTNRLKIIALITGNVHLYIMHPVFEEEKTLPLKNNACPNGVEDQNLEDLNNVIIIGTGFRTIADLNNIGNKFDEGGPTGVEDSATVDQEGLFVEVNMDGTTERINKKESCSDGTTGWATKFKVM